MILTSNRGRANSPMRYGGAVSTPGSAIRSAERRLRSCTRVCRLNARLAEQIARFMEFLRAQPFERFPVRPRASTGRSRSCAASRRARRATLAANGRLHPEGPRGLGLAEEQRDRATRRCSRSDGPFLDAAPPDPTTAWARCEPASGDQSFPKRRRVCRPTARRHGFGIRQANTRRASCARRRSGCANARASAPRCGRPVLAREEIPPFDACSTHSFSSPPGIAAAATTARATRGRGRANPDDGDGAPQKPERGRTRRDHRRRTRRKRAVLGGAGSAPATAGRRGPRRRRNPEEASCRHVRAVAG